jgi:hypothetical protein
MPLSEIDVAIRDTYDAAELYRRLSSVVDRGVGQPVSAQPDLARFSGLWLCSVDHVVRFAAYLDWIVSDRFRIDQLGNDAVVRLRSLAENLRRAAPDMEEWEAFEPPDRASWSSWGSEFVDPGTGYSAAAARALNQVARLTRDARRILETVWGYRPEDPTGRW